MMATAMTMPATRMRPAAPCAQQAVPTYAAAPNPTLIATSNRWLGVVGSIVGHTDSFGTKRTAPDRLTGGLT